MENVIAETKISSFLTRIDEIKKSLKAEIARVQLEIKNLPENPNITRISKNIFTINSSQLRNESWSPFHYDFKQQYEKIAEVIESIPVEQLQDELNNIIKTEKLVITSSFMGVKCSETIVFHPDVLTNIKNLLENKF